jgi:hypothetical protein
MADPLPDRPSPNLSHTKSKIEAATNLRYYWLFFGTGLCFPVFPFSGMIVGSTFT